MLTYKGFEDKYKDDIVNITASIIDYGWNSVGNNWAGHHFTAPNGWDIKTASLHGLEGREGECVFVYSGNAMIYDFSYSFLQSRTWKNILGPFVLFVQEKTGCNEGLAIAAAEYIYALESIAQMQLPAGM